MANFLFVIYICKINFKNVYDHRRRFFLNELRTLEIIDDLMRWVVGTFVDDNFQRVDTIAPDRKYRRSSPDRR